MSRKHVSYYTGLVVVAVSYFVTAKVGLSLNAVSGFATLVWAPTGIALASLLLFGYRLWPAITVAAFLVNLVTGASPLVALAIAIGNTLEPLTGAYLLRRIIGFDTRLERVRDVLGLVVLAAFFSTMVSATVGVSSLLAAGTVHPATFANTWTAWWIGDMLGALVVTPLILIWARQLRAGLQFGKLRVPLLVAALIAIISVVVFSGALWPGHEPSNYAYLLFPPLIWISLRFGQRGSVNAIFIMVVVSITCTLAIYSHQPEDNISQSLVLLQRFMAITATTFMVISAIIAERGRAENMQRQLLQKTIELDEQSAYLRELNRTKDEFISLVSHQLRTPVSGIKMYLGLLIEGRQGKVKPEHLKSIQTAYTLNERQVGLINDLLRVVQVDMGRVKLNREDTDMQQLVAAVVNDLAPSVANRQQSINFVHGSDIYASKVDRVKIASCLENLIDNASKYSQSGKNIEVQLARNRQKISIGIKDEGVGIAQKDVRKLFKKFSRIDNELSIERGGNGLGLYWVKKIVGLHGGKITVNSKPGQGSVFTITIQNA